MSAIVRHRPSNLAPLRPGQTKVIPAGPRQDRTLAAVVSAAHSPSSLAAILVALVQWQKHNKNRPDTIDYTQKKAAWLLDFFDPAKDADSFSPADIERYAKKRRGDVVHGGFAPKPIRNLQQKLKDARDELAKGKSMRRAARAVSIPLHRLRLELEPRPTRLISDATIKKEVDVLIQALRLAKKNGGYHGDHKVLRFEARELPDPRERALTQPEYAKLNLAIRQDRRIWLRIFLRTGCRYGELHRITAADIDHEHIRVRLHAYKGRKNRKQLPRFVPLAKDAYEALSGLAEETPTGPLFPHLAGCPLINPKKRKPNREPTCTCQSDFHRILRIACKHAGIVTVTPNDLRRTYASWMARAGVPEHILKKFMGHSGTSQMLIQVYLQLQADEGQDAVARMLREGQDAVAKLTGLRPPAETRKPSKGRRVVQKPKR